MKTRPNTRRMSMIFPDAVYDDLQAIAERRCSTMTAVMLGAVALERIVERAVAAGGRVLLEDADGTTREVLIR